MDHKEQTYRYKPTIVVVAFNRPHSLNRILGALSQAHYPADVRLVISIDRGENNQDVVGIANDFDWKFGDKEVIYRPENLGLRKHILACGDLTQQYGSIVLLEDDLYVSPCFYQFALETVNYYADDEKIGGIGLYKNEVNSFAGCLPFIPVEDGSDVYFCAAPCSWGQVWLDKKWKKFKAWYDEGQVITEQDKFPDSIKEWPESSWLKYHTKYMAEKEMYYVYPRVSLTTNFADSGVHFDKQVNIFQVNLQLRKESYRLRPLEESLSVYDMYYDLLADRLVQMVPELKEYKFVVDLFGLKNLEYFEEEYVLTRTPSSRPLMKFGMQFRPFVMNVVNHLPGDNIVLTHKKDLLPANGSAMKPYRYYYGHIQARPLATLLKTKLKDKKPFSFFFN